MNNKQKTSVCYIAEYNSGKLTRWKKCSLTTADKLVKCTVKGDVVLNETASNLTMKEGAALQSYFSRISLTNKQGKTWHILPYSPLATQFLSGLLLESKYLIPARQKIAQMLVEVGVIQFKK